MGDLIVVASSPSPDGVGIIAYDPNPEPRSRSHSPAPPSFDSSPAAPAQARPNAGRNTSATQGARPAGQRA